MCVFLPAIFIHTYIHTYIHSVCIYLYTAREESTLNWEKRLLYTTCSYVQADANVPFSVDIHGLCI